MYNLLISPLNKNLQWTFSIIPINQVDLNASLLFLTVKSETESPTFIVKIYFTSTNFPSEMSANS